MNREEFYRKYSNLPVKKRLVIHHFVKNGLAHSLSLVELYRLIDSQNEVRVRAEAEMQSYIDLAEKLLK